MSNALSLAAGEVLSHVCPAATTTAPATRAASTNDSPDRVLLGIVGVGICVLVVWVVRTIVWKGRITLSRTPGRPNRVNPLHPIGIFMFVLCAQSAATWAFKTWFDPNSHEFMTLVWVVSSAAMLIATLVVAKVIFRHGLARGLGLSMRHWVYDTGRGIVAYLAVIPICTGALWVVVSFATEEQCPTHEALVAVKELAGWWRAIVIFAAVVLTPIAEELFFRGIVQSMFRRYLVDPWLAILAASALVALAHGTYWHSVPSIFALGIALGYNYERTGRLYPAMLIHAIFNAVYVSQQLSGPG